MSIVTGGANGIGRALAEQVVRRGGHVVIADLDGTAVTATAAALTSASAADGGSAEAVQVDVAEPGAVADLVERVSREHGRLDFMANNAGILVAGPLMEFTERDWEVAIDVNFRAVVAGTRAAYAVMAEQASRRGQVSGLAHGRGNHGLARGERAGVILNTGSLAGLIPAPRMAPYTSTKWAVVGFSQAVRAEAAAIIAVPPLVTVSA